MIVKKTKITCDLCGFSVEVDENHSHDVGRDKSFPIKPFTFYIGSYYDGHRNESAWEQAHFCYKCHDKVVPTLKLLDNYHTNVSYDKYRKMAIRNFKKWLKPIIESELYDTYKGLLYKIGAYDFLRKDMSEFNDDHALYSIVIGLQNGVLTKYTIEQAVGLDKIKKAMQKDQWESEDKFLDSLREV